MSRVLIVETSLHKDSNSDILAEEFARGARDAGHDVECVSLRGKRIGFCIGCMKCQEGGGCVISDDAKDIAESIRFSDAVAFSTPVYFFGMSGQMKVLLDRTNPLYMQDPRFRSIYLLAAGAGTEDYLVDGTVTGLKGWIGCFDGCRLEGVVCAKGAVQGGDVRKDAASLQAAYEMGRSVR